MENIDKRLETLPPKRQQQFERIRKRRTMFFRSDSEETKQAIIDKTKEQIMEYLAKEEKEKIEGRKHGSKGKKHREKGPERIKMIERKLAENGLDIALMISDLFGVMLKAKHSKKGIRYIGLCPFHKENTPSLSIAPDIGVIKCYGCGIGHQPVNLLSKEFNIKYSQALGMLEKYIYTPEQAKTWREKNEGIKEYYQVTPEQKMKKEFSDSLNRGQISTSPIVPYLSKREFKIRFEERKKNHPQIAPRQDSPTSTEDSGAGDGDGLPF